MSEQKFRSDLFFRLNVFPVHVPPLREREGDIPLLVGHFAQQFSRRMNKAIETIPSATMEALCRYHWPGNIRELQNVIERAVILSTEPALNVDVADLKISKAAHPSKARSKSPTTAHFTTFSSNQNGSRSSGPRPVQLGCGGPEGSRGTSRNEAIHSATQNEKLGISRPSA